MSFRKLSFATIVIFAGCTTLKPDRSPYDLFKMKDFNLEWADEFIEKVSEHPEIKTVSIVDLKTGGNDFKVNGQHIFLDTTLQNRPNYYSYIKRAKEIGVPEQDLREILNAFYNARVNEYTADLDHYRLRVVVGFPMSVRKGYCKLKSHQATIGDTLKATSGKNSRFYYYIQLTEYVEDGWFKYKFSHLAECT